jgi:ADP-heptose:LPS heptosyltransferase
MKLSRLPIVGELIRGFFWEIPSIIALAANRSKGEPAEFPKRLLIIRMDAIGDFLLFLGALRELRIVFTPVEWEITLLGNQVWKELAVALEVADQYHFVDTQKFEINPFYRLKTLSWVGVSGFDMVLQGVYSRSFYRDDVIVRASKAPARIGYHGDSYNSPPAWLSRGNKYYTELIDLPQGSSMHMLVRNARLTAALGGTGNVHLPLLTAGKSLGVTAVSQIDSPYFVIVPGGSARIRQWPPERFAGLSQFIHGRTAFRPIILGGKSDGLTAREVMAAAASLPWLNLSGGTSLLEALAIITQAQVYVGNDTGLTHMATMARVPRVVAIVGGAYPNRYFPYPKGIAPHLTTVNNLPPCKGCRWHCNHIAETRAKCIKDISLETVISKIVWG